MTDREKAINDFEQWCDQMADECPVVCLDALALLKEQEEQIKTLRIANDVIADYLTQPDIVRCKDCKHRDPEDHKCDCGHDIQWQLQRADDWFCADGERKE